jgi:hypothetical protein
VTYAPVEQKDLVEKPVEFIFKYNLFEESSSLGGVYQKLFGSLNNKNSEQLTL